MSEIELKARELLAEMARNFGQPEYAYHIGCGGVLDKGDKKLIGPIIAALTPRWQPIESAPKDGAFYLATNGKDQRVENCPEGHVAGIWHRIDGDWRGSALGDDSTHWQPLPAAPEVEG